MILKGRFYLLLSQGDKIYEIIRQRILDHTYVPSQALVESSLAEELGVSRNTIKKALLRLANDKLVVFKANKSAIVKSLTIEEAVNLFEIRERVEGLIAYLGAQAISEKELDIIKENLENMKSCLEKGDLMGYSKTNDIIHNVLYSICPNEDAIDIIQSIRLQLRRYNKRTILISGRSQDSFNEHQNIYLALKDKDADKAEMMMRQHIRNVREVLKENYNLLF